MASFEYDLNAADYAAFNLHHLMTSDMGLRQRRFYRLSLASASAILSVALISAALQDSAAGIAAGVAAAIIGWLLGPSSWRRAVQRNVRRMAKRDGLGTPGRHVLVLDADGIRENAPTSTMMAPWSSLLRVDETPDHLFIYTDPVRAFVVPVGLGADRLAELRSTLAVHSAGSS